MDTRKVTLIATIAAIALVAVGIGYAYTATTSNTNNDVNSEYIQIKLYASDGTTPKYTGTTTKVEFNTKTVNDSTVQYGVYANTQLTNVEKITLQAFNKTNTNKNVLRLTMTTSADIFDPSKGYVDDKFTVTLTEASGGSPKSWTGVKDGNTWTFTSAVGNVITAPADAAKQYVLVFQINNSGATYPFSAALPATTFDLTFVATEGTPA